MNFVTNIATGRPRLFILMKLSRTITKFLTRWYASFTRNVNVSAG